MSGGIAYVLDADGDFASRCNTELVGFDEIGEADAIELHELIEEHHLRTLSPVAARILEDWEAWLPRFAKVMPHDYKRALSDMATAEHAMRADAEQSEVADVVGAPQTGTSRQS
jgi:glutamate synthase domain-containing protein 3